MYRANHKRIGLLLYQSRGVDLFHLLMDILPVTSLWLIFLSGFIFGDSHWTYQQIVQSGTLSLSFSLFPTPFFHSLPVLKSLFSFKIISEMFSDPSDLRTSLWYDQTQHFIGSIQSLHSPTDKPQVSQLRFSRLLRCRDTNIRSPFGISAPPFRRHEVHSFFVESSFLILLLDITVVFSERGGVTISKGKHPRWDRWE